MTIEQINACVIDWLIYLLNSVAAVETAMEAERMSALVAVTRTESLDVDDLSSMLEMTDYLVYAVTGDRLDAGTLADIHISVIGKQWRF